MSLKENKLGMFLFIALLAFTIRLLYLDSIKDDILFNNPIADSGDYHRQATLIAGGDKQAQDEGLHHRFPFYQYFIAFFYKIFGRHIYISCFFQMLISSFLCGLIYLVASYAFGLNVGAISGFISIFYWPFIAFGAKLLPVNLAIFFLFLFLFFLYLFFNSGKLIFLFLGAFFLALGALCHANLLLVSAVFLGYFFIKLFNFKNFKYGLFCLGIFIAAHAAVFAPYQVNDYKTRKDIMPIQDNYGITMYIGLDLGHVNIQPGSAYRKIMRRMLIDDLTQVTARNKYWIKKIIQYISRDPKRALKNFIQKIYLFFNYYEFSPRENVNYFWEASWLSKLPFISMGSIAALGILGFVASFWSGSVEKKFLLFTAIAIFSAILPFAPFSRYRLLAVPFIIIFAAFAAEKVFKDFYFKNTKNLIVFSGLFVPLLFLTNYNPYEGYLGTFCRTNYYVGSGFFKNGNYEDAVKYFKKALYLNPKDADIYYALGNVFLSGRDRISAKRAYQLAVMHENEFPEAYEKLGVLYAMENDYESAVKIFKEILAGYPTEIASTHINLGNCYLYMGRPIDAEKEYRRALEIDPENELAKFRLEELIKHIGRKIPER